MYQIERLLSEGKVPVIVGGTHYYIESIIWKVLIDDPGSESDDDRLVFEKDQPANGVDVPELGDDDHLLKNATFTEEGVGHMTSKRLHELLKRVDPAKADALHPNDRRKIIR